MQHLTLKQFTEILNYHIDNNKREIDKGHTPIAICIEGEAGIGKTAVCERVAKERGMTLITKNLAQIEEPADLLGFPYKEYKVISPEGKEAWISADLIRDINCNFQYTNESRMSYAVPSWVPREENPNGTVLFLDDYTRANPLIMQAIMELINTGSFMTWSLPKYTNIVLSSNPDNGEFLVSSMDRAMSTRLITFSAVFDVHDWAAWAENFGIDGKAINFALLYADELFEPKENVVLANARSYTNFCREISGIENWSDTASLGRILQIASGCFQGKDNIVGSLFTRFLQEKLDKLITPKEILTGKWEDVVKKLEEAVYDKEDNTRFRADIASVLGNRLINYTVKNLNKKGEDGISAKDFVNRLDKIYYHEKEGKGKQLFSEDIIFYLGSTISGLPGLPLSQYFTSEHCLPVLSQP